ncbi:MAG: rhodanese-like domain-containing protein [Anaerolineae bacterium]|nr:rhodanese-like domain-containing protein [Anaerolineae bacterium]
MTRLNKILTLAILLFILTAVLIGCADKPYPTEVSVKTAREYQQAGAFMLDVRQPEEWDEAHIPDSTLIPLNELTTRLNEIPADREIVVVCRSGNRSAQARDILRNAGYKKVTSMSGGIRQWIAAGYPTINGK